jgi:RsiW-degrading membrane proteinase PrsW (M82 family)
LNGSLDNPQVSEGFSWLTLFQLVLSLLAASGLIAFSLFFALIGLGQFSSQVSGMPDLVSTYMYAGSLAFVGFLMLPSAGYALQRMMKGEKKRSQYVFNPRWLILASGLLVILLPLVLIAGNLILKYEKISWILLPFLHILAVSIPVFWLVTVGLNGLKPVSGQRVWGLLGAGSALGPILILVLELTLLAGFVVTAIFLVAMQPEKASELANLLQRLRLAPNNPAILEQFLQPFLASPAVVASVFVYIAVLVPLIEETFKPIGVWLLAGRKLTPIDGFMAGVLSGAGYALFENLFLSSGGEQWVSVVLARVGTGAVHIFTTSLVGWGLASAWGQRRYLRLALSFALAVGLHGLWNGLTIFTVGSQISTIPGIGSLPQVGYILPFVLISLALLCILMIWLFNRAMKRAIIASLPLAEGEIDREIETDEV